MSQKKTSYMTSNKKSDVTNKFFTNIKLNQTIITKSNYNY